MDKILVTRSSMPEFEEYIDEIRDLWSSHWLTNMGDKHNLFAEQLKEYLEVCNIELFTNGHMALELSLQSIKSSELSGYYSEDYDERPQVITTPFTFASTTHAIVRNGYKPVFCDINPDDFTINVSKIRNLINKKTVAIMPVHVYGNICDVNGIDKIAKEYGLKVIYDAAHCFGETYKGVGIANFGDISCFSFHATKVFNSIEGGAAVFHDQYIGKRLYELKNFGIADEVTVSGIGANAKMNEFCAAMGICNLRHIEEEIQKRKQIVDLYRDNLQNMPGIQLNVVQQEVKNNYGYFPIVVKTVPRERVIEALKKENIFARKYFYPIANEFQCYKGSFNSEETPIALDISKKVMTLPLYADLELSMAEKITHIIKHLM